MTSKWDDEFDFDENPQAKKPKQDYKKNRNTTPNNDFYDLEEEPKNIKLPTIAKNIATTNEKHTKSNASINLAEIPKRKLDAAPPKKTEKEEEQDYEFEESLAPNPSSIQKKSPKVQQKKTLSPPKKEEEDAYANEEFEEDKYEEDFETHEEHKPSPIGYKPKQQSKQPAKVNVPKPAPKDRKGAESVAKKAQISGKGNSRNSIRSQSATRSANNSRPKAQEKKEEAPNKYTNLAEKSCPTYQRSSLEECNIERLTRENDKIRALIKRFNDELNDLINKNIMQLKNKKEEKVVPAEDIIKVLEEQRNSNETALQTTIKELQRLKGKEGELKEEEFQISLQQKIAQTKAALNELTKNITKLKLDVNNEGNKLTKIDKQASSTQQINNIKSSLISIKKDQQKNDQILQKLYIKCQELTRKISQAEGKYNSQIDEARTKGLSVQINPQLVKKAEDIKKKIEVCRLHKSKTESLFKTKCDMITHECDQVKLQSKAVENSIQTCLNNCEEIQSQSKKIVEKAKKGGKISEDLISTLENIISELENGTPRSNRDKEDASTFTHPKGAKKYQSQKNVEKIIPQPQPKEQTQDDSSLKKPTLFKKKQKEEEKQDERVWKDDKNAQAKKQEKTTPIPELARFENKQESERKEEEKKKPFVIKRNKESKTESEPAAEPVREEPKVQPKKQAQKNEEIPSLAPRMMKFRRNKPQEAAKNDQGNKQAAQKPAPVQNSHKESPKIEEKQAPSQQQAEKPIFAPKRFNLKLKDRTNQQAGYVATTIQKKEEPKPVEQFKPKAIEQLKPKAAEQFKPKAVEQFKPKGLTIDKEPFSIASEPKTEPLKILQPKLTSEEEEKPKFNLRLRDRQRQSNKTENKIEVAVQIAKEEPKIPITLDDKAKENNQYANPYANTEAPKRQREGPLKKQKPVQNVQKQNFNIYQQAEDITNMKDIKLGDSPKVPPPKQPTEEPNLHDLLGIKKNKQAVDEDLLIDPTLLGKRAGGKKATNKETNFFGDLEI